MRVGADETTVLVGPSGGSGIGTTGTDLDSRARRAADERRRTWREYQKLKTVGGCFYQDKKSLSNQRKRRKAMPTPFCNRDAWTVIPEGRIGEYAVQRFTVSEEEGKRERLRALFNHGRCVPPGTYTKLMHGTDIWMSDTPDELRDLIPLYLKAKEGLVLINGLGLGCAVQMVLQEPTTEVVVVEIAKEVVELVGKPLQERYGCRLQIICANAFDYQPPVGVRYSSVWHDIWRDICADNLPEMSKLKRRYGKRTEWQGCWMEDFLRRQTRQ